LHPIEQRQGEDEFPFVQGDGSLSEYHHLKDEAEYPQKGGNAYHDPVLHEDAECDACKDTSKEQKS
jgi:hypothetical protein